MAPWAASISCRHVPGPPSWASRGERSEPWFPLPLHRGQLDADLLLPGARLFLPGSVCGHSLDVCFLSFYFHEGCENNF